jgi:hypothetical protein
MISKKVAAQGNEMSKDITEKDAALISAAIIAYLAKPSLPRGVESSEGAPNKSAFRGTQVASKSSGKARRENR